jgi:hypothetical protein
LNTGTEGKPQESMEKDGYLSDKVRGFKRIKLYPHFDDQIWKKNSII